MTLFKNLIESFLTLIVLKENEKIFDLLTPRYRNFVIGHMGGVTSIIKMFPEAEGEITVSIDDSYIETTKSALIALGCYNQNGRIFIVKILFLLKMEGLDWKVDNIFPLDAETYNVKYIS